MLTILYIAVKLICAIIISEQIVCNIKMSANKAIFYSVCIIPELFYCKGNFY